MRKSFPGAGTIWAECCLSKKLGGFQHKNTFFMKSPWRGQVWSCSGVECWVKVGSDWAGISVVRICCVKVMICNDKELKFFPGNQCFSNLVVSKVLMALWAIILCIIC